MNSNSTGEKDINPFEICYGMPVLSNGGNQSTGEKTPSSYPQ